MQGLARQSGLYPVASPGWDNPKTRQDKTRQDKTRLCPQLCAGRGVFGPLREVVRAKQQSTLKNLLELLSGQFKQVAAGTASATPAYAAPETQHLEWLWEQHAQAQKAAQPPSFLQARDGRGGAFRGV